MSEKAVSEAVANNEKKMYAEYQGKLEAVRLQSNSARDQAIVECTAVLTKRHKMNQSKILHDLKMSLSAQHAEELKRVKAESRKAFELAVNKSVTDREIALSTEKDRAISAALVECRASLEQEFSDKLVQSMQENDRKWQAVLNQRETELNADFDSRIQQYAIEAQNTLDSTRATIEAAHDAKFRDAQKNLIAIRAELTCEKAKWEKTRTNMNSAFEDKVKQLCEVHREEIIRARDEARVTAKIETEDLLAAQHAQALSERETEFAAELRATVESVLAERSAIYDANTNEIRNGLKAKYQTRISSVETEKEATMNKLVHKENHIQLLKSLIKTQRGQFFAIFDQIRQHIDDMYSTNEHVVSATSNTNISIPTCDVTYSLDEFANKFEQCNESWLKLMSSELEKRDEESALALEATLRRANSRHIRRVTSAIQKRDIHWQALLKAALQESDSKHSTTFHANPSLSQTPLTAGSSDSCNIVKKESPASLKMTIKKSRSSRGRHPFDDIANTSSTAASEVQELKLQLERERQARWDAFSGIMKQPISPSMTAHIDIGSRLVAFAIEGDSVCLEMLLKKAGIQSLESHAALALGYSTRSTLALHRAVAGFSFHADESRLMETLTVLLRFGADVSVIDSKGDSVLHKSVGLRLPSAALNISEFLIKQHGASIEMVNMFGNTPLHNVLLHNIGDATPALVRLLVTAGSNVRAMNAEGQTPLDLARLLRGAASDQQQRDQILHDLQTLSVELPCNGA